MELVSWRYEVLLPGLPGDSRAGGGCAGVMEVVLAGRVSLRIRRAGGGRYI